MFFGLISSGNLFIENESMPPNDVISIGEKHGFIYRYLKHKYAIDFVNKGYFRVSPLTSYRDSNLGARADESEGLSITSLPSNSNIYWKATDGYSLSFSRFPLQHLTDKFDSVCVKIEKPEEFILLLDQLVREKLQSMGFPVFSSRANDVGYTDIPNFDFGPYGCAWHQAFIKPHMNMINNNHYWIEGEYRLFWDLGKKYKKKLDCLTIESKEITSYLSIVDQKDIWDDSKIKDIKVRKYTEKLHSEWIKYRSSLKK